MTEIEILLAVRGLLSDPDRWFKGGLARAADDRKVSITHPHACKFSLDGAFYRVQYITKAQCGPAYTRVKKIISKNQVVSLANFNDARGTTHWAVIQLLDRAILQLGGVPPLNLDSE